MANLDHEIQVVGKQIFQRMGNQKVSIFNKDWWYGQIMDWSMKNESFKTQMFRFVDVLPYLNSGPEVARHLKEYFAEGGDELPSVFNFGLGLGSLAPGLMAGAVKKNVTQMAKMFITGETPKDALPVLKKQRKGNIGFTIDLLGEATLSEKEALDYQSRYLDLINWLTKDAASWKTMELIDRDSWGELPIVNVSVKLTAIYSQIKQTAWNQSKEKIKDRLRPILDLAIEKRVFINIDMEAYDVKDLTLEVFKEIICEEKYKTYPHFGIVVQAYLRDSYADCKALAELAEDRQVPFTVRLVKGAYWDYETVEAKQKNWPVPVYTIKAESDANYEKCCELLLDRSKSVKLAIGSHNVRSIAHAICYAKSIGLEKSAVEFQMLYGMADPIKASLVEMGYRVREYATVGELIPGMAYLVRRLLENTSNESFLKSKYIDNVDTDRLLQSPSITLEQNPQQQNPPSEEHFSNQALLDFAEKSAREKTQMALEKVKSQLPISVPIVIDGKEISSETVLSRENPSQLTQVVGQIHMATIEHAEQAVSVAKKAFLSWSKEDPKHRAHLLDQMANLMERDREKLSAIQILEIGKPWLEADADVAEAIDFCRYYAQQMRDMAEPFRMGHAPGEVTHYSYVPRGVTAVIAPWNFPLAILTGMAGAAAVSGNTVIVKPAEQSSTTAQSFIQLAKEAGFPDGVFALLPGEGPVVGSYLVDHKDVAAIGFTGSKAVGLEIIRKASEVKPGQTHVKKCIAEMGGKNAIIIDNDADLDEAVKGVIYSAFGFQGQKCSACSRALVHKDIKERFLERLLEATKSLEVAPAEDPTCFVGPVIDQEAKNKILDLIESGKSEAKLLHQSPVSDTGHFIGPTIFTDVRPDSRIATEEIFGPVLAVISVDSVEQAVEIALDSEYALTGGLYSRSPVNIEKVKSTYLVGNLYINRGCTGALVERHPFGGFKLSGVGVKTGGPDYVKQFMDARCVIENTMRRGFTPDLTT